MLVELNDKGVTECGKWKLVPVEPTLKMTHSVWCVESFSAKETYKSMLAAAPTYKKGE